MAGLGFFTADIFSDPPKGPLWAVAFGLVGWSVAGAVTLHRVRRARGLVVWALSYLVALWLGSIWGDNFERNGSAGFVGTLLGWAVGGALGALASAYMNATHRRRIGPIIVAAAWGLSFFVAGYISVVAGMLLAQGAKDVLAFLGSQRAALTIGWALGAAIGGTLASAIGIAARDRIIGPPTDAAV